MKVKIEAKEVKIYDLGNKIKYMEIEAKQLNA